MNKVANYFRMILVFFASFLLTFVCFTVLTALVTAFANKLLLEAMSTMYQLYAIITLVISIIVTYKYAVQILVLKPLHLYLHEETTSIIPDNK